MKERPKIGFFDFTCCEGCQLQVANLGEALLELLEQVELVEFRELLSETWSGTLDLAVVEGSITTAAGEQRLRRLRQRSKCLIAYGACATTGGVNGLKNRRPLRESQLAVYGAEHPWIGSLPTRALHQVVAVDYLVNGCPIHPAEFLRVLQAALAGLPYAVPDYAVCVECKCNENICVFDQGTTCLGPITRAGCDAWCVNHGNICYGCRGLVSRPNRAGAEAVLRRHGLSAVAIANKMSLYQAALETDHD